MQENDSRLRMTGLHKGGRRRFEEGDKLAMVEASASAAKRSEWVVSEISSVNPVNLPLAKNAHDGVALADVARRQRPSERSPVIWKTWHAAWTDSEYSMEIMLVPSHRSKFVAARNWLAMEIDKERRLW